MHLICDVCQCSAADFTAATLQSRIARVLAQTYAPDALSVPVELLNRLDQTNGWSAKLDAVAEYAAAQRGQHFNAAYMRSFTTGLYQRALASVRYALASMDENATVHKQRLPQQRIEATVTLVRAADGAVSEIDERYGLQVCTAGRIDVQIVPGNHQTVLQTARLLEIINGL